MLSPFAGLKENTKYSTMRVSKNVSPFSMFLVLRFLIQRMLNWVKLGWNQAQLSLRACVFEYCVKLEITVKNANSVRRDFFAFSGIALSTRYLPRSLSLLLRKTNRSAILTFILVWEFFKIGEYHSSSDIRDLAGVYSVTWRV